MIPTNLGDLLQVVTLQATKTDTSSQAGSTAVDIRTFEGEMAFILNSAKGSANADNTMDLKLQHSADGSTGWADITGGAFAQVLGSSGADSVQKLSLNKNELGGWVRYVSTLAGSGPSYRFGLVAVGMKKYADGA